MPELNDVLSLLVHSTREVNFEMPSEIRRRGERRRMVRRAAMTGLIVVSVVGIGVGSAWALNEPVPPPDVTTTATHTDPPATSAPRTGPPGPTLGTTPPTTTTPPGTRPPTGSPRSTGEPATPTTIPTSAMLRPADVGSGYTASDTQEGDDHGSIAMLMSYCGQGDYSSADEHLTANRRRNLSRDDQRYVLQEVSGYQNTWAARHLNDLRAVLPRCATVDIMGDPNRRATLAVVDNDFAGDGAILIREILNGAVQYHAVVRQGNVEARLRIHTGATQSQARTVVVAAAGRLCNATPSC